MTVLDLNPRLLAARTQRDQGAIDAEIVMPGDAYEASLRFYLLPFTIAETMLRACWARPQ